jgi:hypothetical protein
MTPTIISKRDGELVSPAITPLLEGVYEEIKKQSPSQQVASALHLLLSFLSSPVGRTNANCWAVDLFFMVSDGWECEWDHLDEELQDIIGDIAGALHDTVQAPEIARDFDSTPEQLLQRLERYQAKANDA